VSSDTKWIIGTIVPAILVVGGLLSVQITGVNGRIDDLNSRLERLETDVRSMDERLRAVEVGFGKIDQRLETLERAILPTV
jgi:outer membrane murein-binding lipoprotein Lpp